MNESRISRHSVLLDASACKGCTNCLKRCPVEAIRVRKGKASILEDRCVDCGECILACPYKAKKADTDTLEVLKDYDYRIALVAPALYAQFEGLPWETLLEGLSGLGFQDAFDVAEAAELVSAETRRLLAAAERPVPMLSSSCPAVVRLILVRYPGLVSNLSPVLAPMEVAARMAKERAAAAGVRGRIGAFFLTPCPAKVTAARLPIGHGSSAVNGSIAIRDIYLPLSSAIAAGRPVRVAPGDAPSSGPGVSSSEERSAVFKPGGAPGIAWARPEGETEGVAVEPGVDGSAEDRIRAVAVDGMDRVVELLEEVENGRLGHVDFVELLACPGGCLGGPLNVENATLAKARLREQEAQRDKSALLDRGADLGAASRERERKMDLRWSTFPEPRPALLLHGDYSVAAKMLEELERIADELPGLDCGSCGAPSCRALAEDIVRGVATRNDCIFILRERLRGLTRELMDLESLEPPSLDRRHESEGPGDDTGGEPHPS